MRRKPKAVDEIKFVAPEPAEPEIPQQPEFYKLPTRFGAVPVDEAPLGWVIETRPRKTKTTKFRHAYPVIRLPFQEVQRVEFGHSSEFSSSDLFPVGANRLFFGDCLHVMRQLPSNSIDLIYIDPPFFSGRQYNMIFGDKNEIRSFNDIWEGGMPGYLLWLNARLFEMKRLLKRSGSIYVHLDWHAVHYVKTQMDAIFGYENFRNEIIWFYPFAGRSKSTFPKKHDSLLWYSRGPKYVFNGKSPLVRVPITDKSVEHNYRYVDENGRRYRDDPRTSGKTYRYYLDEGKIPEDVWTDIQSLHFELSERIGYPTQKPEKLLNGL